MGVISFQKIFGLYGLKHHIVEISGDVTDVGQDKPKQTTSEDRATQLLIWETLSLAISFGPKMKKTTALTPICKKCSFVEVSFSTNFRSSWNPANNKTTLNFEFYKWKFETKESINVLFLMIFLKL